MLQHELSRTLEMGGTLSMASAFARQRIEGKNMDETQCRTGTPSTTPQGSPPEQTVPTESNASIGEGLSLGQPHPAELSGASSDLKLRLMGIPRELRDNIFRYLLLFHKEIYLEFQCTTGWNNPLDFYTTRRLRLLSAPEEAAIMFTGNRKEVCQKIDLVILRVCRQTLEECRPILYGENRWFFTQTLAFQRLFLDYPNAAFGTVKASFLRNLTIWPAMEKDNKADTAMSYQAFVNFMCTRLPALQHLHVLSP